MARIAREEQLGGLGVQLANGKRLSVRDLQDNARVVVVAGTPGQVTAAVQAAAPYRDELVKRGVFLVMAPIYGGWGTVYIGQVYAKWCEGLCYIGDSRDNDAMWEALSKGIGAGAAVMRGWATQQGGWYKECQCSLCCREQYAPVHGMCMSFWLPACR